MRPAAQISQRSSILTVDVLLTVRKRGGRKLVVAPEGNEAWLPSRARVDTTMVKALARAHRWSRLLECGKYAGVSELAEAENINKSYLCRVLRLTLLAPDIVEAILDGRNLPSLQMKQILRPFPIDWASQRQALAQCVAPN